MVYSCMYMNLCKIVNTYSNSSIPYDLNIEVLKIIINREFAFYIVFCFCFVSTFCLVNELGTCL